MELKLLNEQGQPSSTVAAADTVFGRDFRKIAPKCVTAPRSPSVRKAPAAPVPV
jgi:hypothetical protein